MHIYVCIQYKGIHTHTRARAHTHTHTHTHTHMLCCAESLQLCPTLCHHMDYSFSGSSVGFFRQELSSRALLDPGIKLVVPAPPALQVDSLPQSHQGMCVILLPYAIQFVKQEKSDANHF